MDTTFTPLDPVPAQSSRGFGLWNVKHKVIGQMWWPRWTGRAISEADAIERARLAFYGTGHIRDDDAVARLPLRLLSVHRFEDRRSAPREDTLAAVVTAVDTSETQPETQP